MPTNRGEKIDRALYHAKPRQYRFDPLTEQIITVEKWQEMAGSEGFHSSDGWGYWVKDGKESWDEVSSTPVKDATHVAWYKKR